MTRFVLLALALAGCADLPRDPEGTATRVAATRTMTVGLVAPLTPADRHVAALVGRLARETGARPRYVAGAQEPLLHAVEKGRLDLAIGFFERDTPWDARVALAPPLDAAAPADRAITVRPAMQSGENRWIMTVERAARAVSDG